MLAKTARGVVSRWAGVLLSAILMATVAQGQEAPQYNNLRFEENWSAWNPEESEDFFGPVKKIDVTGEVWVSVGGQHRLRIENWSDFGFADANDDTFVLNRTFVHTDWHFGEHWRLFVEGKFSHSSFRDLPGGRRDALDADEGDIWNTFLEGRYDVGDVTLTTRLGRMELQYGKQRLVSPLDWSNNRRIFEGALLRVDDDDKVWRVDLFVTRPVLNDRNSFNDSDKEKAFSGIYYTQKLHGGKYGLDAYFLALNANNSPPLDFDRYTAGARFFGNLTDRLAFDVEGAYQFGNIAGRDIRAWMLAAEASYTFKNTPWTPSFTLGVDYASGDHDPTDGQAETFNHLFPLGHAYMGFIDIIGRQNIIDARAGVSAWPIEKKMKAGVDLHFFWLAEESDALYNAGGGVVRMPLRVRYDGTILPVDDRGVGAEVDFTLSHKFTSHFNALLGYSHFFPGNFIDKTGLHDSTDFLYAQATFTF